MNIYSLASVVLLFVFYFFSLNFSYVVATVVFVLSILTMIAAVAKEFNTLTNKTHLKAVK